MLSYRNIRCSVLSFAVLLSAISLFALQAPYLISATAQTDTSVLLSYRNNDASSTGFIVFRKDTTATVYHIVDSVKSATQLTCLDLRGLKPSKLYTYQVWAYNASAVSDTSNSVNVTTPAVPVMIDTFKAPRISVFWNYDTSGTVQVLIWDSSNCESGYRIYRDSAFSSSFKLIAQIPSANPVSKGKINFSDSAFSPNTWYRYKAAAYRSTDSLLSQNCSTFTFKIRRAQQLPKFTKMSSFPISDSAGWASKSGDSIILHEKNDPAGKFTAINVHNPAAPVFAGYIDSTALMGYPMQTLIPAYLKFGASNGYGPAATRVVRAGSKVLVSNRLYQVNGSSFVQTDSIRLPGSLFGGTLQLDDSTFAVLSNDSTSLAGAKRYYWLIPVHLSPSGFSKDSTFQIGWIDYEIVYLSPFFDKASILGIYNNTLLWGNKNGNAARIDTVYMQSYNLTSKKYSKCLGTDTSRAFHFNSGYYFSPTLFLSLDTNHVYAENVIDINGYQTALSNNAVLPDSFVHRQNVIIDTANKLLFILYRNNMSTYSYSFITVGVKSSLVQSPVLHADLTVLPGPRSSGVTILLPASSRNADLCFYDLSGRVVDRMIGVNSNAVVWRPKARGSRCYLVSARINGERYEAKFMK